MEYVLDEMQKALKYNVRQLQENLRKIQLSEESIADLKLRNERHKQAIKEIGEYIEKLQDSRDLPIELPFEKQPISIIEGDS